MAGVAPITASRVYRGSPNVSEKTREKVLTAGQQCGYRLHAGARSLRTRRFDSIGLLLSTREHHSHLSERLLLGIADALEARRQSFQIMRCTDEQLTTPTFVPRMLAERMVDGLLINYTTDIPPLFVRRLHDQSPPSVWINTRRETDCVYFDFLGGAMKAVHRLAEIGHRSIAYLDLSNNLAKPGTTHYSAADACEGCHRAAMAQGANIHFQALNTGLVPGSERVNAALAILRASNRPTALLAYSDHHALACVHAAILLGLRIPEDLSIVVFTNEHPCDKSGTHFDALVVPDYAMGRTAADRLMIKIKSPERALPPTRIELSLLPGHTCAPPPRHH